MNTNNPTWTKQFKLEYRFNEKQIIIVKVYDHDNGGLNEYIGSAVFLLGGVLASSGKSATMPIQDGMKIGSVTLKASPVNQTKDTLVCNFSGKKLVNKDGFFGKSDPFLVISRQRDDGTYMPVWKNAPIMNDLSPTWPISKIPLQALCNGDINKPIRIEIFDYDSNGKHDFMGLVDTTTAGLQSTYGIEFNVIEPKKQDKSKSYVNSGTLHVSNGYIEKEPTFLTYISGGCEVSLAVAIDFTAANGDPNDPNSLHFISPTGTYNEYQQAIAAAGEILEVYDTNRMFPVYGIGASVRLPDGTFAPESNCFKLNNGNEVHGTAGILQAYRDTIVNISMGTNNTVLHTVLETVGDSCRGRCTQQQQSYNVLLIITKGNICDMDATIDALVRYNSCPLSIVIVGVGDSDFYGNTTIHFLSIYR
jgi:hypothetical protein